MKRKQVSGSMLGTTVSHRSGFEEESRVWEVWWAIRVHGPEGLLSQTLCSVCAYVSGNVHSCGKGCVQERCPLEEGLWMKVQGDMSHHPQRAGPDQEICGGSWSETTIFTVFIQKPTTLLHLPQWTQELALSQRGVPEAGDFEVAMPTKPRKVQQLRITGHPR